MRCVNVQRLQQHSADYAHPDAAVRCVNVIERRRSLGSLLTTQQTSRDGFPAKLLFWLTRYPSSGGQMKGWQPGVLGSVSAQLHLGCRQQEQEQHAHQLNGFLHMP